MTKYTHYEEQTNLSVVVVFLAGAWQSSVIYVITIIVPGGQQYTAELLL